MLLPDADPSMSFRVELLLPVLDRLLNELKLRFSDQALSIIGSLASAVCPSSSKFLIFEDIRPLLSVYGEVCGINESPCSRIKSNQSNQIKLFYSAPKS